MNVEDWERQYLMLCRRYRRKKDTDECVSYYEYFSHFRYDSFVLALKSLKRANRYFPTPLEIENAYHGIDNREQGDRGEKQKCDHCNEGYVFFTIGDRPYSYANPCAYCRERSTVRQVVAKPDGSVWWAFVAAGKTDQGDRIYSADIGHLVEVKKAKANE